MKVLDLRCGRQHVFEGWFASEDAFVGQNERSEVACPICGDTAVIRLPSAPRINVGRSAEPASRSHRASKSDALSNADASSGSTATGDRADGGETGSGAGESMPSTALMTLQSQRLRAVRHVMRTTEDVGDRFAEEARRIHYGEVEERGIRGRASEEDAKALREEGIDVMALPIPDALKEPLQ